MQVRNCLEQRGACFTGDLQRLCTLTKQQVQTALWELATAGLASADGFDQLRAMMDPKRKPLAAEPIVNGAKRGSTQPPVAAGRCSTARTRRSSPRRRRRVSLKLPWNLRHGSCCSAMASCSATSLQRESNAPRWRDLLRMLRRLEARGDVRGGRFVTGFSGEQYALPEAVESLRLQRNTTR